MDQSRQSHDRDSSRSDGSEEEPVGYGVGMQRKRRSTTFDELYYNRDCRASSRTVAQTIHEKLDGSTMINEKLDEIRSHSAHRLDASEKRAVRAEMEANDLLRQITGRARGQSERRWAAASCTCKLLGRVWTALPVVVPGSCFRACWDSMITLLVIVSTVWQSRAHTAVHARTLHRRAVLFSPVFVHCVGDRWRCPYRSLSMRSFECLRRACTPRGMSPT